MVCQCAPSPYPVIASRHTPLFGRHDGLIIGVSCICACLGDSVVFPAARIRRPALQVARL